MAKNLPHRLAVKLGNARKIFLVPSALLHQTGDFAGKIGNLGGGDQPSSPIDLNHWPCVAKKVIIGMEETALR